MAIDDLFSKFEKKLQGETGLTPGSGPQAESNAQEAISKASHFSNTGGFSPSLGGFGSSHKESKAVKIFKSLQSLVSNSVLSKNTVNQLIEKIGLDLKDRLLPEWNNLPQFIAYLNANKALV